jgi:hypothetical protein
VFLEDVAEAKRRNFTVKICREIIEKELRAAAPGLTKSAVCTGPLSDPRIRAFGRETLADMRRQGTWASPGLSLNGVLQDFIWKLQHEKIYERLGGQQLYYDALSRSDLNALQACFPGLEELLAEKRQKIRDQENAKAAAEAEARRPINRLITGYMRYAYVKYCNEVRQGYVAVYVNEVELERARNAAKGIEDDALREDGTLDKNALWSAALAQIAGKYVNRDQCQMELDALLKQNPRGTTIEKDF